MSINWKAIQTDYPKAWAELVKWISTVIATGFYKDAVFIDAGGDLNYSSHRSEHDPLPIRHLYDLFDQMGVYISVTRMPPDEVRYSSVMPPDPVPGHFSYFIDYGDGGVTNPRHYTTRPEAEAAAFTEAFKILESQLPPLNIG